MQRCPYCKGDQSEMFAIISEEAPKADTIVALCTECGELIVHAASGLGSRPPDEHVEMHNNDKVRVARAAWLMFEQLKQRDEYPPIRKAWGLFFDKAVAAKRLGLQSFENNHQLWDTFRDAFYAGCAHTMYLTQEAYNEADTYEEFEGRMLLLNTELQAYGNSRTGKRNGK